MIGPCISVTENFLKFLIVLHNYLEKNTLKYIKNSKLNVRLLIIALRTFFNVLYAGTESFYFYRAYFS